MGLGAIERANRDRSSGAAPRGGHLLALVLAIGLLAGCQQGKAVESSRKPSPGLELGDGLPDEGTPGIQAAVDRLIDEGGRASGARQMEYANQIARFGEHGLPGLLRGLRHPQPGSRILSAYMLGLSDDPRVLTGLEGALQDPEPAVRLEAATALLRHGDRRGLPTLVGSLRSADPRTRARGISVLKERTGTDMGFRPTDPPGERAAALARWDNYVARLGQGLGTGSTAR